MVKKHRFSIEVEINYPPDAWHDLVSNKVVQILTRLRNDVKELGGKVQIRY